MGQRPLFISPEYLEGLSFSATLGEAQKLKVARAPKIFCHRSFFLTDYKITAEGRLYFSRWGRGRVFGSFLKKKWRAGRESY